MTFFLESVEIFWSFLEKFYLLVIKMTTNTKLLALLDTVIECYLDKGEPVGSKFLNSLEVVDYVSQHPRKARNGISTLQFLWKNSNTPVTLCLLRFNTGSET